ncbi:YqaA family protein [Chloroflexota bacterium]
MKNKLMHLLAFLLVIAIMSAAVYCLLYFPERADQLKNYGYLGAFLISLLFNATVILPAGNMLVLAVLGAALPSATVVGLVGGAGAAVGEITGYVAGYSGRGLLGRGEMYGRVEGWVEKWGSLAIFLLSLFPLVFDLAGIAAGAVRFRFWKFLLWCWLGRTILYVFIAIAGAQGWEAVLHYFA